MMYNGLIILTERGTRRMLRRFFLLLMTLLVTCPALAEEAAPPAELRFCDTVEEAEAFLLYPPEGDIAGVAAGYVRLVAQHRAGDDAYRAEYWLGGEPDSPLDLNLQQNRYGHVYTFHAGNMCTRAAYSMALSYLGVDATPGGMSAMTGKRDMNPPYPAISEMVGVELVQPRNHVFDTMVENYLADPSYSPVYVYIRKPDGQDHALLVIAKLPEKSRYLVLDPSGMWVNGVQHRIYMMSFNKTRQQVVNSTFRDEYAGSKVLALYQWRKTDAEAGNE